MEDVLLISEVATQEAVFWFIPIIALAALAGVGNVILIRTITSIWVSGDHLGMAVLGMPESGKTTWYDYLLKTNRSGMHTVDSVEIDGFKISFSDGKSVIVKKGKDIGGDAEKIPIYYSKMIENNDIVLFFLNIERYLGSMAYERDANSRLDFIYFSWKEKKGDKDPSKTVYLIMTHVDKVSNSKEAIEKVLNRMRRRSFSAITTQYTAINMINNEQLEELKKIIFRRDGK